MNALVALDSVARHRLLALMGVDVYVLRGPRVARADPKAARAGAALVVMCDSTDADGSPLSGPYGPLLRHVLAALQLGGDDVRFGAGKLPDGTPWLCFGPVLAEADKDAILAAPLATLRQSAEAKRALWRTLKPLRRSIAER